MNRTFSFLLFILFFISAVCSVSGQQPGGESEPEPAWVLYQKGLGYYDDKDFGEAFRYLRKAAENNDFPEAEYRIGKIFENEGENTLALKQYERALSVSWNAKSSDFRVQIQLAIAGIYEKQKKYNLYQDILEKSINEIKTENRMDRNYEDVLRDRLMDNGLDKLIFYFRHEGDSLIKLSGDLGVYYFAHSRDRNAVKYLASAVTIISTQLIGLNREYDPQYSYESFRRLFLESEKNPYMAEYMASSDLYRYLFYLALSLDNSGMPDQSGYIFSILSDSSAKNSYTDMSLRIKRNNYSAGYKDGIKKALLVPAEK